jgi:hypothetical protein
MGHSFGCFVTLSLLPFLPKTKETTIILVDPAIEFTEAQFKNSQNVFLRLTTKVETPEEHMAENPAWSRRDCVLRTLGVAMVDPDTVEVFKVIFQVLKLEALLTNSAFASNSETYHGLPVGCSKTYHPTSRSPYWHQIQSSTRIVSWSTSLVTSRD